MPINFDRIKENTAKSQKPQYARRKAAAPEVKRQLAPEIAASAGIAPGDAAYLIEEAIEEVLRRLLEKMAPGAPDVPFSQSEYREMLTDEVMAILAEWDEQGKLAQLLHEKALLEQSEDHGL